VIQATPAIICSVGTINIKERRLGLWLRQAGRKLMLCLGDNVPPFVLDRNVP